MPGQGSNTPVGALKSLTLVVEAFGGSEGGYLRG